MASCCPPGAAGYLAADHADKGAKKSADGVEYYQAGSGKIGLLICPDVWGWNGGRTRALADEFAEKHGLNVFIPKLLSPFEGGTDGDGLPPAFDIGARGSVLGTLLGGDWGSATTVPMLLKVVAAMKADGVEKFGCMGFCYGAWVGLKLSAQVPEMICGVSPHPSAHIEGMLGGDPAKLGEASLCPWAFFPAGVVGEPGGDPDIYDAEGLLFQALEKKFPGKNVTKRFSEMQHGWSVRGHIKEEEHNAGRGEAVQAAVAEVVDDTVSFFDQAGLIRGQKRKHEEE